MDSTTDSVIISLDKTASTILSWVAGGASHSGHGEYLVIEQLSNGDVSISTNNPIGKREMVVTPESNDSTQHSTYAVRAKAVAGIINKMGDDDSLGISLSPSSISFSCGNSSVQLNNMYERLFDVRGDHPDRLVTVADGYLAATMHRLGSSISPNDLIYFSCDGNELTLNSHSGDVYTQELVPVSNIASAGTQGFALTGGIVKPAKKIHDTLDVQDLSIYEGQGFVRFCFTQENGDVNVSEVSLTCPCPVHSYEDLNTPCSGQIATEIMKVEKKHMRAGLSSVSGVVGDDAFVSIDSTNEGRVVIKVSDVDGSAKTVIMEALTLTPVSIKVPLESLKTAIKGIGSKEIVFGTIVYDDEKWMSVMPVFNEDDDNEQGDTTIAIPTSPLHSAD